MLIFQRRKIIIIIISSSSVWLRRDGIQTICCWKYCVVEWLQQQQKELYELNGRKKESKYSAVCSDTNENKNKFKGPKMSERRKKWFSCVWNKSFFFFYFGLVRWTSSLVRLCLYEKYESHFVVAFEKCIFFFSLIHSEIFIHHSRFFSSFRLLTRSTSQITTLVYKFYKQTYTNMRVLLICVNF